MQTSSMSVSNQQPNRFCGYVSTVPGWDVVGFEGCEPMDVKPNSEQPADLLRWLNTRRRCSLELVNGSTLQGRTTMARAAWAGWAREGKVSTHPFMS